MDITIDEALKKGIEAHQSGKYNDAEKYYRIVLEEDPVHPDAHHNLGVLALNTGKTEVGTSLIKKAIDLAPTQKQFWVTYLDALISQDLIREARECLLDPRLMEISAGFIGDLEKKLQGSWITSSPPESEINKLLEFYGSKNYGEAKELALSVSERFPSFQFGWKLLGVLYMELTRYSEASTAFKRALSLDSEDFETHNNLGVLFEKLSDREKAIQSYERAVEINPNFIEGHKNLGKLYAEDGRMIEASSSYKKVIALNPNFAEAYSNMGSIFFTQGNLEAAKLNLKKAVELDPSLASAYSILGNVHVEQGQLDDALTLYERAIELDPYLATAHANLGNLFKILGKIDQSVVSCKKAISLDSKLPEPVYTLALILYENHQYKEAAEKFQSIDYQQSENYALRCYFLSDNQAEFYSQLDLLDSERKTNAFVGSLTSRSELRYGIDRKNFFCAEPLRYVTSCDMRDRCDFVNAFAEPSKRVLSEKSTSFKEQGLLTNGKQTAGNIFRFKDKAFEEMEAVIRREVASYHSKFLGSEEGLIKFWPESYDLFGWLVSLKSGGSLRPHMHEDGWISGSIYINVPPKQEKNTGNLVVCIDDEESNNSQPSTPKTIIEVNTGTLCLFPSSLLHYTLPFVSDEKRIVLAFDVIPI